MQIFAMKLRMRMRRRDQKKLPTRFVIEAIHLNGFKMQFFTCTILSVPRLKGEDEKEE